MNFITDKQTLDDLNLLGKFRPGSIYSIFNQVQTAGGERLLDAMFAHPLTDPAAINQRSACFAWFQQQRWSFPADREAVMGMEQFIEGGSGATRLFVTTGLARKKLMAAVLKDDAYHRAATGLQTTWQVLNDCKTWLLQIDDHPLSPYYTALAQLRRILSDARLSWLGTPVDTQRLPVITMAGYVHLLQHTLRAEMEQLLELLYEIDVFIAVAKVAGAKGFHYAKALPATANVFDIMHLRHPALDKGVGNDLHFHAANNLLFLTGANMAGKSTFMKAFGIGVYLAHMGFPVAAEQLIFSVRDGIYTSINVPDNINLGYSHFYAEVLRVKHVAEEVSRSKKLVVLFDELFKGTNVKDAYDATLAVTAAFAAYRDCCFIISTHIIELGEALEEYGNIQFSFLPTIMEGTVPRYTYRLQSGITADRQGMTIIENEKILEILDI